MIRAFPILLTLAGCVAAEEAEIRPLRLFEEGYGTAERPVMFTASLLPWPGPAPDELPLWSDAIAMVTPTELPPTPVFSAAVAEGRETWVPTIGAEGALALTAQGTASAPVTEAAAGAAGAVVVAIVVGEVVGLVTCGFFERCRDRLTGLANLLSFGRVEDSIRTPRGAAVCGGGVDLGIATSATSADGLLRIETCWRPADGGICTHCPAEGELQVTPQILERASSAVGIELVNYGDSTITLEPTARTPELVAGKLSRSRAAVQLSGAPVTVWIRSQNGLRQAVILRP